MGNIYYLIVGLKAIDIYILTYFRILLNIKINTYIY